MPGAKVFGFGQRGQVKLSAIQILEPEKGPAGILGPFD